MAAKLSALITCSMRQGVLRGDRRIDPEAGQPLRQQAVALVNALGNLLSGRKQRDKAARVHGDIAVFAQVAHGDADARLGELQLICNVDGTHKALTLLEHQNGLQIILGGFLNLHRP